MKYQYRVIYSICFSLITGLLVGYLLWSPIAGISAFSAAFLIVQFSLTNYDNRTDWKIQTEFCKTDRDGSCMALIGQNSIEFKFGGSINENWLGNDLQVSILNVGGKPIHIKTGGIITKTGILINFNQNPDKKGRHSITVVPGENWTITTPNSTLINQLILKEWDPKEGLIFKGFFQDQLNNEYSSRQYKKVKLSNDFLKMSE